MYEQKNAPSRYFGSPLTSVVGEDGVPSFIRQCVEIIEQHGGLDMEGIYRLSGKKEACLELQDKFDEGNGHVVYLCLHLV